MTMTFSQTDPADLQLQTECIPVAPILTLHRALAATAADSQCENRIGSGGLDNRLLVAPPKMNSRHFACP